jgi:hypothetical protein
MVMMLLETFEIGEWLACLSPINDFASTVSGGIKRWIKIPSTWTASCCDEHDLDFEMTHPSLLRWYFGFRVA